MCCICYSSESAEVDIIELAHIVKAPRDILERVSKAVKYKYCVFSSANEIMKPLEFISGALISTGTGRVIDRALRKENLLLLDDQNRMCVRVCVFACACGVYSLHMSYNMYISQHFPR